MTARVVFVMIRVCVSGGRAEDVAGVGQEMVTRDETFVENEYGPTTYRDYFCLHYYIYHSRASEVFEHTDRDQAWLEKATLAK